MPRAFKFSITRYWPWSVINELKAENEKWINHYLGLYKSRQQVLKYMDTLESGRHECVADRLYIFKPDGVWVEVDPDEIPYAPL